MGKTRAVTISEERVDASAILGTLGPALKPQAVGRQTSAFSFACLAASAAAVCSFIFFSAAAMASKQLGQTRSSNYHLHQHTRPTGLLGCFPWLEQQWLLRSTQEAAFCTATAPLAQSPRIGDCTHTSFFASAATCSAEAFSASKAWTPCYQPFHRGHRVVPTPHAARATARARLCIFCGLLGLECIPGRL